MYTGNERAAERLIAGHQSAGVLAESELRAHLMVFRRLRGAVQAVYFSKRLHEADLTGATGQDDNAHGLGDAHTILRAAGAQLQTFPNACWFLGLTPTERDNPARPIPASLPRFDAESPSASQPRVANHRPLHRPGGSLPPQVVRGDEGRTCWWSETSST